MFSFGKAKSQCFGENFKAHRKFRIDMGAISSSRVMSRWDGLRVLDKKNNAMLPEYTMTISQEVQSLTGHTHNTLMWRMRGAMINIMRFVLTPVS